MKDRNNAILSTIIEVGGPIVADWLIKKWGGNKEKPSNNSPKR